MVRHISTLLAVPSQAHTRLSPMGLTRSAPTVESSSLRIGWQDSLVTHGPIALRCPGSGRFPPMNAPLISVSFPNIVRNSRSRPIECEFWKMLQGHVLRHRKSGTHSEPTQTKVLLYRPKRKSDTKVKQTNRRSAPPSHDGGADAPHRRDARGRYRIV